MPSISLHLGRSLFLACCGTFMYYGENTEERNSQSNLTLTDSSNANPLPELVKNDSYPSWIAPPSRKYNSNETGGIEKIGIHINIPSGNEGNVKVKETPPLSNATHREPNSNIIQINIFNNGAPVSFPSVVNTEDLSSNTSKISISSGGDGNVAKAASLQPPATIASVMYQPPKKDNPNDTLPWWKTSVIYQIYPRSFKDSTGSGTGDLPGITSKLDYLEMLGIGAVWLSPIYVSPMADFGYDVADFRNVDPTFGSLKDFDNMREELHKRGMKLIMDFIPNHSSDEHDWFQRSVKREDPYSDYYVWQKPKGYTGTGDPIPPNNWLSFFGGSAWEWSPEREEFYLHQFLKKQPDLNVRNPSVMEELDNILRFWLDRGVDGFRIDALKFLYEIEDMGSNEPLNPNSKAKDPREYESLNHTLSTNRPETVEAVKRWREVTDEYDNRFMMVEVYDDDIEEITKYYDTPANPVAHFPFNFFFITEFGNRSDVTGLKLKEVSEQWLDSMPSSNNWPNWVLGNHDRARVASRLGEDLIDALNMFLLLLPGTPTSYYGDEIGMTDTFISFEDARDPFGHNFGPKRYAEFGRDPQRTPMQWDDTPHAGFSSGNSTWLPVNQNYFTTNVKKQENEENSHLKVFMQLAKLRKNDAFRRGNFSFPFTSDNIMTLKRWFEGGSSFLLLINTSEEEASTAELFTEVAEEEHPTPRGRVVLRSSTDHRTHTAPGSELNLSSIRLLGGEGLVLEITEDSP